MRNRSSRASSWSLLASFSTLLCATPAWAEADTFGLGAGTADYAGPGGQINTYVAITANVTAGANPAHVSVGPVSGTALAIGNLVLLWQPTGLSTDPGWNQASVDISSEQVGQWEFARISALGNPLTLSSPTLNSYAANRAQLVVVPEWVNVTVPVAGFTALDWDGARGGIIAFLAKGMVTLNGDISADARGFRGGAVTTSNSSGCMNDSGITADGYSQKGEGVFFQDFTTTTAQGCGKGSIANGGGGGNCRDSAGGGGGLAAAGGAGGISNGGNDTGGVGGAALTPLTRLLFGGGGGGGANYTGGDATQGARGGGVVFFRAASLAGTGSVTANGAKAADATNDAAGGGGAGGTILIRLAGTATCNKISARGGGGGVSQMQGGGGGGSSGHVTVQAATGGTCPLDATVGSRGTGGAGSGGPGTHHDGNDGSGVTPEHVDGAWCTTGVSCTDLVRSVCDTANQICVGCLVKADCKGNGKPVCEPTSHLCRACSSDGDCSGGSKVVCETGASSTLVGSCVDCSGSRGCTAPKMCDPATDTCVACASSTDCTNPTHICDATLHTCRACTTGDTCPSAVPLCVTAAPLSGWCVECTPGDLSRCIASLPMCDSTGLCAACDGNHDDTSPEHCPTAAEFYCNTTGPLFGRCTECTDSTQCPASQPVCGADGKCGCSVDGDCGGGQSGKVCVSSACVAGCHTPGNGCPVGQQCTSTTAAVGVCFTPGEDAGPPPDAQALADAQVAEDAQVAGDAEVVLDASVDQDAQAILLDAGPRPDVGPAGDAMPPGEPDASAHNATYNLGGCGCSAAGPGLPLFVLGAFALLGLRRQRR